MTGSFVFACIDEPPFCFPGESGVEGYDVEVASAVLATIGIRDVETRLVTFAELIPGLVAGRWQINTPLFVTPERERLVAFSRAAWALADGLLIRRGDTPDVTSYEALAAVPGLRLVVVAGQVQDQSARLAGLASERILRVASPEAAVAAIRSGPADAYASVAWAHRGFLQRRADPGLAVVEFGAGSPGKAVRAPGAYGFAKHDTALRDGFDVALTAFWDCPEHRAVMQRYGFTDVDMTPTQPALLPGEIDL